MVCKGQRADPVRGFAALYCQITGMGPIKFVHVVYDGRIGVVKRIDIDISTYINRIAQDAAHTDCIPVIGSAFRSNAALIE